jgi:hypothetical protein
MSFLILNNGKVEVTEEGKLISEVTALYNSDKSSKKKFYNDTLTYIYFSYKNNGIYCNKLPKSRKQFVIDKHLLDRTINDFERHPRCKELIDIYIDLEYTPIERLYEGLKRDIEDILKRIDTIPYEKEIMVEFESEVDLGKGEKDIKKFKQRVIMDNSEEKEKKMELAIKLFDYDKKLQSKMFDESKEKRRSITAKFDKIPDKERSLSLSL